MELKYKGYTARVRFDNSIQALHGRLLGIRDIITFEGKTKASAEEAFHKSVEDYLNWCAEEGRTP